MDEKRYGNHFHKDAYPLNPDGAIWEELFMYLSTGTGSGVSVSNPLRLIPANSRRCFVTDFSVCALQTGPNGELPDQLSWSIRRNNQATLFGDGPFDGFNGDMSQIVPIQFDAGDEVRIAVTNNGLAATVSEYRFRLRLYYEQK